MNICLFMFIFKTIWIPWRNICAKLIPTRSIHVSDISQGIGCSFVFVVFRFSRLNITQHYSIFIIQHSTKTILNKKIQCMCCWISSSAGFKYTYRLVFYNGTLLLLTCKIMYMYLCKIRYSTSCHTLPMVTGQKTS